jgi:hypothetical protein
MPRSSDYGAHAVLSGFAARYRNYAYIADEVSPIVEVDPAQGYYYEFGQSDDFDEYETEITEEGSVTESKSRRTQRSYSTLDFSHAEFLPVKAEEEGELLGFKDIDLVVERVTDVVLRKRDIYVAGEAFDTGNFSGMTSSPGTKWGTATVKQVVTDVNTAKDALVAPGSDDELVVVMGLAAWRTLSTNANILAAITPTKAAAQATLEQMAALLEVDRIVVGKGKKNTGAKVETDTVTRTNIWGDHALVCYRTKRPSVMGNTGHNVTFRKKVGGRGLNVYLIPEHRGAHGGTLVKVSLTEKPFQVVNAQAGYLLSAISA